MYCRDPSDPKKKLFIPEAKVMEQLIAIFRSIQIPEKLLDALRSHMKASHEAENQFHLVAINGLRCGHYQTRDRLSTLLDLRLDQSITQDEYDKKRRELKE